VWHASNGGGHADVPRVYTLGYRNAALRAGLSQSREVMSKRVAFMPGREDDRAPSPYSTFGDPTHGSPDW